MSLYERLLQQAGAFSVLEVIAVLLAIAYLLLAIRQNIWCWLCAGISTAIYVWLFIGARLYMESVLNGFYFLMAIYGWIVWNAGRDERHERPVVVWPLTTHMAAILCIVAASVVNGFLLSRYTSAAYPYIDSLTTWSAIWATFLVARKVLENWWYWLAIDSASIVIYWARDLQLTAMLFVIYVIMIPFGLYIWTRSYQRQTA
ncbi:MAG: nicotinamide riboside transporter PnuC [Gammaproteobacteria bacterium]|nr:nicotinamide riboside transporter PnuC [Gammaproteobacteria bacterium]